MRILVAGQLVEDIDQQNRIHEMMQFLLRKKAESMMQQKLSAYIMINMIWSVQMNMQVYEQVRVVKVSLSPQAVF